ncbi:MAG: hypothetical protein WD734_04700 [Dehalococcoidia bacterium]
MDQGSVSHLLGGAASGIARVLEVISDLSDRGARALDRRVEEREEQDDIRAHEEAMAEGRAQGFKPWDEVKKDLGL